MAFWLVSTLGTRSADGFSFPLLKHWVRYYVELGVPPERFRMSLFSSDLSDNMGWVAEWLIEQGIAPLRCIPDSARFNPLDDHDERRRIRSELPADDWIIPVDADEFYEYPEPVPSLLDKLDAGGFDGIDGYFVDRVAADFSLPEITDAPLFEQFPLETQITRYIVKGCPDKICGIKNRYEYICGHHHTYGGPRPNYGPSCLKVHHFKWRKGLRERAARHLALADPRYTWKHECQNLLRVLSDDDRLLLKRSQVM